MGKLEGIGRDEPSRGGVYYRSDIDAHTGVVTNGTTNTSKVRFGEGVWKGICELQRRNPPAAAEKLRHLMQDAPRLPDPLDDLF